ncbi:MAG: efflux RND transporter periplasmic adaptor subunit [Epsilonproteobacteria bacterium]|nr:efflux RND transporter periplasmic adaptor subunit [Campylobacterota bacterium]
MRIALLIFLTLQLQATTIELTAEQEKDWQIETQTPQSSEVVRLGEFIAQVTTPPQYLYSITLPFEAQVQKLHVAPYEQVEKEQLLAEVTGKTWIETQQQFIADAIELKHYEQVAKRKNLLCREEIIPKKECVASNAKLTTYKSKLSASKTLLFSYGATPTMVKKLYESLTINPTLTIHSPTNGKLLKLNVRVGKSTTASEALFIIQREGELWLECELPVTKATHLSRGQKVNIAFANQTFESELLLHAPTINPENQTQKVRFSLPQEKTLLSGLRDTATISIENKILKVAKKSVISLDGKNTVFLKTAKGYEVLAIEIIGEEGSNYYLKDMPQLHNPIATTSVLILKSLMEGEDE